MDPKLIVGVVVGIVVIAVLALAYVRNRRSTKHKPAAKVRG